jgi:NADPH:quinone reductase
VTRSMRAVIIPRLGAADVLATEERQVREPNAGEVLIRNQSAGVNFIDALIRRGEVPTPMMPPLPFVPGVEGAGIVEAAGEGVGYSAGQPVMWFGPLGAGGYGGLSIVNSAYVVPIEASIDPAVAAAVPVNYMTAHHMLFNLGRARRGDWVLVHAAAGGVGTAILQLARKAGISTIASVSTNKVKHAIEAGATHAIDYRKEDVAARARELSGGGVNLTLNPIGGDTVRRDVTCLAPLGQVIIFGFLGGMPTGTLTDTLAANFSRSIAIRVSDIYAYYQSDPIGFNTDFRQLAALLTAGEIEPRLHARIPVSDAAAAHRMLESGQVIGKVVLTHTQ